MKSNKWKTVRVYISSTFKDFHAECILIVENNIFWYYNTGIRMTK